VVGERERDLATGPAGAVGVGDRRAIKHARVRWLIPAWDARYEDIAGAQRVFVPIANRGVYIRALTAGPIVFWTRHDADVLEHLQLHGVAVDWSVGQIPWGVHLDHQP
jgi:hypothetical protein